MSTIIIENHGKLFVIIRESYGFEKFEIGRNPEWCNYGSEGPLKDTWGLWRTHKQSYIYFNISRLEKVYNDANFLRITLIYLD